MLLNSTKNQITQLLDKYDNINMVKIRTHENIYTKITTIDIIVTYWNFGNLCMHEYKSFYTESYQYAQELANGIVLFYQLQYEKGKKWL